MHFGSLIAQGRRPRSSATPKCAARIWAEWQAMILEIKGIDSFYGLGHSFTRLSLAVAEGEVVALLERNGAGKNHDFATVTGLTPPLAGEIRYKGKDIAGLAPTRSPAWALPSSLRRAAFSYLTAARALAIARPPRLALADGQPCSSAFPPCASAWRAGAPALGGEQGNARHRPRADDRARAPPPRRSRRRGSPRWS